MIVYVFHGKESDEPTIAKVFGLRISNILTASGVKGEYRRREDYSNNSFMRRGFQSQRLQKIFQN